MSLPGDAASRDSADLRLRLERRRNDVVAPTIAPEELRGYVAVVMHSAAVPRRLLIQTVRSVCFLD